MDSLMLRQLVTEPTRGSTTLDLVLIKSPHHTDDVLINESFEKSFSVSDHRPVKSTWLCSGTPTVNESWSKTYSFTNCDYDDAKNMILDTFFSPICYSNINKMVDEWCDWIFKIIDASVPVRSNHRAQLSPWVTGRTSNVLKKLSTAEKHKKSEPKIQSLRNEAALYLDEDIVEYETKLFSGRNTGSIFKYMKSLKKDNQLPSVIRWKEVSADSNLRKANLFNDYFISVFTRNTLDVQLGESDSKLPDGRVASDYQIDRDVVYNVLSNLDISRSRGEDQLPPVFLRKLATELTPSVFSVFRNIHNLDTFPEKWKLGIVRPIFKKGKKSEISNYRPVILLNIVSKCFEKIAFSQIADHFIEYVNSVQFGFCLVNLPFFNYYIAWTTFMHQ